MRICKFILAALWLAFLVVAPVAAREITDMAGRRVTVPDTIRKVYGVSPPATYMVYAIDPDLIAGLNWLPNPTETEYLDPRLRELPVIGGLFGQGQTANIETLLQVKPDIALIWLWQASARNEKIESALRPTGVPIVYLNLHELSDYPRAFQFMGELLDRRERGETLGKYAEKVLAEAAHARTKIAENERLTVYYAEGADGLSTECADSEHARLIPLGGAVNVHRCSDTGSYGMQKISMEQLLGYDPDIIISHEPLYFDRLKNDSRWQALRAVREGRVYRIPRIPFNWFDRPPSFMRLLGIQWMLHRIYPHAFPIDLAAETQRFYRLFLNLNLDETQAQKLLQP